MPECGSLNSLDIKDLIFLAWTFGFAFLRAKLIPMRDLPWAWDLWVTHCMKTSLKMDSDLASI